MVRDPTWAHAYWDISIDRINDVVGTRSGGRACLCLIALRTGHVLAEHAVRAERGSHGFALPEADRWYRVELAIIRNDRWVVLARSNVVHAPPKTPRAAREPAFVSRARQPRGLAEGPAPGSAGHGGHAVPPRMGESPQGMQTAVRRGPAGAPASMASEPNNLRLAWIGTAPCSARFGSATRTARARARPFRYRPKSRYSGARGCRTPRACRECVVWTRSSTYSRRRKRAGARASRRRNLLRTCRSDSRPSGARRGGARSRHPRYIRTQLGGLHGDCGSRRLNYRYWPGREFDHVQPGPVRERRRSGHTIGRGCHWGASRVLALAADLRGCERAGTPPEPDRRSSAACGASLRALKGSPAQRRQPRSTARRGSDNSRSGLSHIHHVIP